MNANSQKIRGMLVDDRLSRLPDEIRYRILSLMPTIFSVRTSVLSKTWRCSWMFVTSLQFDDTHDKKIRSEIVDRVMKLCESPQIDLFRLHIRSCSFEKSIVSNWIDKAVRLNVCKLDIDVTRLEVPLSMFTCKTLTKLRIHHRDVAVWECDLPVWECPWPVHLPCLKTLDIAVLNNPYVNAFILIGGCPVLEDLSLQVKTRNDEDDYIFNIPTLKRLKLTVERAYRNNRVILNVPNLEYLFVGGMLASLFVVEDLPSLVEASVSFNSVTSHHLLDELLKVISGVGSLLIEKLRGKYGYASTLPIFPNMKCLEFKSHCRTRLILQFLESCPKLKDLCLVELPYSTERIELNLVPTCMRTNLTSIKLSYCSGLPSELQFLEYMLGNAEVLKSVTITSEDYIIEKEKLLCAHLTQLQRASRDCEIRFIGPSFNSARHEKKKVPLYEEL